MEIGEAFTQEAIAHAEVDLNEGEEDELRGVISQVSQANEVELTRSQQSIVVLGFIAGRAYEQQFADPDPMVSVRLSTMLKMLAPLLGEAES